MRPTSDQQAGIRDSRPSGIGLFEPLEGLIALAETGMHERQPSRGNIPFARSLFERPQHLAGFAVTTERREEIPSGGDRHMSTASEAPRARKGVQGGIAPAKLLVATKPRIVFCWLFGSDSVDRFSDQSRPDLASLSEPARVQRARF